MEKKLTLSGHIHKMLDDTVVSGITKGPHRRRGQEEDAQTTQKNIVTLSARWRQTGWNGIR